ncbi:MAG: hypothetical protein ABI862_14945 [Ilumatobacteraceae bacterium]
MAIDTDDHVIWPYATTDGYGIVYIDGKPRRTHVVVLERRVGPRPPGMMGCHALGCPRLCMNGRHLRWDTAAGNEADKVSDGTVVRGAKFWKTKLSEADVRSVRRRYADGELRQEIAADLGVTPSAVYAIIRGQSWSWLE